MAYRRGISRSTAPSAELDSPTFAPTRSASQHHSWCCMTKLGYRTSFCMKSRMPVWGAIMATTQRGRRRPGAWEQRQPPASRTAPNHQPHTWESAPAGTRLNASALHARSCPAPSAPRSTTRLTPSSGTRSRPRASLGTLAGYTGDRVKTDGPDFELLSQMVSAFPEFPVFCEGRIHTTEHARQVIDAGAWAAVVGTAITHPTTITSWFRGAVEG